MGGREVAKGVCFFFFFFFSIVGLRSAVGCVVLRALGGVVPERGSLADNTSQLQYENSY